MKGRTSTIKSLIRLHKGLMRLLTSVIRPLENFTKPQNGFIRPLDLRGPYEVFKEPWALGPVGH